MTETTGERAALAENFLFKGIPEGLLARVVALGSVVEYGAGQTLFRKGDAGDKLFSIISGEVEISVDKEDGSRYLLNTLRAGSTFGEIALLDSRPRTADATVVAESRMLVLERSSFWSLLRSEPALLEHIMHLLCERVRWVSDLIDERNREELELRKLTRAVEASPSSVIITDTAGVIEYVNPRCAAVTGWGEGELIGQRTSIFQSGQTPPETYHELWRTITAGGEWRGELLNRRKDGELYWESCRIAPIFDADGEIVYFVAVKEDMTERKRMEEELRRLATTDPLTGTANRRHFMDQAGHEIARSRRQGTPVTVAMFDIDHFKKVNDTYGHGVGDEALKAFAAALLECFREEDTVGRLGGEEFAVLMLNADLEHGALAAERLRRSVEAIAVPTEQGVLRFTCSTGVAQLEPAREEIEAVLGRADEALYSAKSGGRNRVVTAV